ncbi:MAG: peroxiredoxin [Verrucomicrobiae bacterium]|nr:peroxiredoxin [Verrucomicrobiae bacterium]
MKTSFPLLLILAFSTAALSQDRPVPKSSPNQKPKSERHDTPDTDGRNRTPRPGNLRMGNQTIVIPGEFRTIDGTGNNEAHPEWGSTEEPFLRLTTPAYGEGGIEPSGADRPSARAVSNAVAAQEESMPNRRGVSGFLWQWGQFLDHDIDLTPVSDPVEPFDIPVPAGDPFFDPAGTGTAVIGLDRSFSEIVEGHLEQFNELTAFIDASQVYGSDPERAEDLRTNDGTGRLRTSDGDLLPFNVNGLPNAPTDQDPSFFIAGDFRANEQVGLMTMHTLFVREHNYWAGQIATANSGLSDDQIYESARAIVGAEIQAITYNEFLPLLIGPRPLPRYTGYRPGVNPTIANEFATAAYRFGHTMLPLELLRLDSSGREIEEGNLPLAKAFFNVAALTKEGGIDPVLRGLAAQPSQELDNRLVDGVRNFLFGPPGAGGFDLASLNIQRGRDHGLAAYASVRRELSLKAPRKFSDITPDRDLQDRLASVYGSVDQIDLWVGILAEPPLRDALLGETAVTILRNQFTRLRDGDRFWYQSHLGREMASLIDRQTLARIIRRNTGIGNEIQENVFLVPPPMMQGPGGKGGPGRGMGRGGR